MLRSDNTRFALAKALMVTPEEAERVAKRLAGHLRAKGLASHNPDLAHQIERGLCFVLQDVRMARAPENIACPAHRRSPGLRAHYAVIVALSKERGLGAKAISTHLRQNRKAPYPSLTSIKSVLKDLK